MLQELTMAVRLTSGGPSRATARRRARLVKNGHPVNLRARRSWFPGPICRQRPLSLFLALAVAASLLATACGCSSFPSARSGSDPGTRAFFAQVRPAADTARLLHNARYYKLWGRPELALKELEEAYGNDPGNVKVADLLARTYEERGDFRRAQEIYQQALSRHEGQPLLSNNLCFSYYQEGRWEEAEACFRQLLARDPQNVAARNNLGLVLCRLDRLEEAHRLWQAAEGAAAATKMTLALKSLGKDATAYARAAGPAPAAPPVASARPAQPGPGAAAPKAAPATRPENKPAIAAKAGAGKKPAEQPVPAGRPGAMAPKPVKPAAAAAVPLGPAARPPRAPTARQEPLRAVELAGTAIEIRNGTPTRHLARRTSTRLAREGYHIRWFGNHRDFGAAKTVILYRPEVARVARVLSSSFFAGADYQMTASLRRGTDIKIILGADLVPKQPLLAHLASE